MRRPPLGVWPLLVLLATSPLLGQGSGLAARILLDGSTADWQAFPPRLSDPADAAAGELDLGRLWLANDEHYLFLCFETGRRISLQDGNQLALYLDIDDDPETGLAFHGLGAEVVWRFGQRRGELHSSAGPLPLQPHSIGLLTGPTVTSDVFEIALGRIALPRPEFPLFRQRSFRLALADGESGDRLPNEPGGILYRFEDPDEMVPVPPLTLDKAGPSDLRIVAHNVNRQLADPERRGAFGRIYKALAPDVLVLPEVSGLSALQVQGLLTRLLGGTWQAMKQGGEDVVVVSRLPFTRARPLGGGGAYLLKDGTGPLLLITLSAPCCQQHRARQEEFDGIMAFLRRARQGEGPIPIAEGTPVILAGDANLTGPADQLRILLHGEIADSETFGAPFLPDWDGTPLADAKPRHTHRLLLSTWYGPDFPPARLDYVLYTDSVLELTKAYILYTPQIPPSMLQAHGLERSDVPAASRHLPVVADFRRTSAKPDNKGQEALP